jgi:hypothetical protein
MVQNIPRCKSLHSNGAIVTIFIIFYLHFTERLHLLDASPPELIATTLYSPASSR